MWEGEVVLSEIQVLACQWIAFKKTKKAEHGCKCAGREVGVDKWV